MSDILGIGEARKAIDLAFDLIRWLTNKPIVYGKVTQRDRRTPVSGITVHIGNKNTVTAQNGAFIIEGMGTGGKQIDLEFDGERIENVAQIYVKSRGSIVTIKEPLLLSAKWEPLFPMLGQQVEGYVFDLQENAVGGATVKFGDKHKAATAQSGKFIIQVPPGVYTISILHQGVLHNYVEVAHISLETKNLEPILFEPKKADTLPAPLRSAENNNPYAIKNLEKLKTVNPSSLSDQIREFINDNYIAPARERGESRITIRAGDVHSEMKLDNRYPAVCSALRGGKLQEQFGIQLLEQKGPDNGANVYYTFELLSDFSPSFEVLYQHFFEALEKKLANILDDEWKIRNEFRGERVKKWSGFELVHSAWEHKCRIRLEPQEKEVGRVIVGIARREKKDYFIDSSRLAPLGEGRSSVWWVWYNYTDNPYKYFHDENNRQRLLELYAGNEENELFSYYFDELMRIIELAHPILTQATTPEELEKRRKHIERTAQFEELLERSFTRFENQLPANFTIGGGSRSKHYRFYYPASAHWALHYEFLLYSDKGLGVEIHIEQKQFADKTSFLKSLAQQLSNKTEFDVYFDPEWSYGGRLVWFHPPETSPDVVAENMHRLIELSQTALWQEDENNDG